METWTIQVQTDLQISASSPRKHKLSQIVEIKNAESVCLQKENLKQKKLIEEKERDEQLQTITKKKFKQAATKFLPPGLAAVVKTHAFCIFYLSPLIQNYNREI